MSTLDVACGRCDRRFRVRAEFAGKSTRCPGCSAPIAIGASTQAPPRRREEPAERPRPRPRDDEDDRPRPAGGDWGPVDTALGREQVAVVFVLITILSSYLVYCIGAAAGGPGPDGVVIALMLLLLVGPSLTAGVFGMTARAAALRAPPATGSRGAAVASLLCGLAGLASLVMLGLTLLAGIDQQGPRSELPGVVATGGLVLSTVAALGTFVGFVAQVGIARRSAEVGRAVGRAAVGGCVCLLSLLGIGVLYTLIAELGPPSYGHAPGHYYRPHDAFYQVVLGILLPFAFGAMLVLYHRLLAAARRAVRGEAAERYDG